MKVLYKAYAFESNEELLSTKNAYDSIMLEESDSDTVQFSKRVTARQLLKLVDDEKIREMVVPDLFDLGNSIVDAVGTIKLLTSTKILVTISALNVSSSMISQWNLLCSVLESASKLSFEPKKRVGRPKNTLLSSEAFLKKKKSIEIKRLLQENWRVRDIANKLECSLSTINKVRKLIEPQGDGEFQNWVKYNNLDMSITHYLKSNKLPQIVKWLGSKERELQHILPELPLSFNVYYEPFVGGGSVYTSIKADQYFINDKSDELISLYQSLQNENLEFIRHLSEINTSWKLLDTLFDDNIDFFEQECANYLKGKIKKQQLTTHIYEFVLEHSASFLELFEGTIDKKQGNFLLEIKNSLGDKLSRIKKLKVKNEKLPVLDAIETALKGAFYYHLRNIYNKKEEYKLAPELSAALFFFIKQYCFSGMSRYDGSGNFNVAYSGRSYNRKYLDKKINYFTSKEFNNLLDKTSIANFDFLEFFNLNAPSESDFVFLDPPYDETFSAYSNNSFDQDDHKRLANYLINDCKAKWMMVVKKTEFIQGLYADNDLTIKPFKKKYTISMKNRNNKDVEHLLIKNY